MASHEPGRPLAHTDILWEGIDVDFSPLDIIGLSPCGRRRKSLAWLRLEEVARKGNRVVEAFPRLPHQIFGDVDEQICRLLIRKFRHQIRIIEKMFYIPGDAAMIRDDTHDTMV